MFLPLHLFFLTVNGTWQPSTLEPSVAPSIFKIIFKRLASEVFHHLIPPAPQTPPSPCGTPVWNPCRSHIRPLLVQDSLVLMPPVSSHVPSSVQTALPLYRENPSGPLKLTSNDALTGWGCRQNDHPREFRVWESEPISLSFDLCPNVSLILALVICK